MWIQPALSESMMSKSFRIASKKGAGSPDSAADPVFIVDVISFIHFICIRFCQTSEFGVRTEITCRLLRSCRPAASCLSSSSFASPVPGVVVVAAAGGGRGRRSVVLSGPASGQARARFLHLNCHL